MIKRIIALLCILLIVGVGFNYYVLETTDERFDLTKDLPQQVAAEIPDCVIYADLPPQLIKLCLLWKTSASLVIPALILLL